MLEVLIIPAFCSNLLETDEELLLCTLEGFPAFKSAVGHSSQDGRKKNCCILHFEFFVYASALIFGAQLFAFSLSGRIPSLGNISYDIFGCGIYG